MKKAIVINATGHIAQWRDYGENADAFPAATDGTTEIDLPEDFEFPDSDRWYVDGKFTTVAPEDRRALIDDLTGYVTQWRDYVQFAYPELQAGTSEIELPAGFEIPESATWYVNGNFTQTDPTPPIPEPVPSVVTMKQARLALLTAGKYDAVQSAINSLTGDEGMAARIEWDFSPTVERDSNLVKSLASALGMDSAALDELFKSAAKI